MKITKLPNKYLMLDHHWPASETPFKWLERMNKIAFLSTFKFLIHTSTMCLFCCILLTFSHVIISSFLLVPIVHNLFNCHYDNTAAGTYLPGMGGIVTIGFTLDFCVNPVVDMTFVIGWDV